ncbi:hypothetical protein KL918_003887 [Ogataea parapolymorpha]|uniref:Endonuclease III homolog n=1 Tax=Ogataea parapolymorpha (strain ATCC 26012 / BCRC 20466 / JCM 22074 / NRRL Y-7560 / DL-1) TaxID=871575 RepID=W1QEQ7_OGAPD|nr:DNA N-glycosylase and apurinic/apyrimidinic (AP) lyase involved in base excision repair [Ogataea parapolymorpha DL-1]ESW98368.1 DNA N-glycosylase and apurinic/apyrimidinic (AP) lyase involved in base excision repair [Ogataea parapolymorpha DL-1]KAG7865899.1 hypothetical protein KL918_003887 [Ogataea parapolymorpha]KAG7874948.1 hypothetical protein KL916_001193 [Ogataea parapolymorpha]
MVLKKIKDELGPSLYFTERQTRRSRLTASPSKVSTIDETNDAKEIYEYESKELLSISPQSNKHHDVMNSKRRRSQVKTESDSKDLIAAVKIKKQRVSRATSTETLPTQPPPHFWPMYNEIKKMRSRIKAPVDEMGCANVATTVSGLSEGKVYRFQCLISLMLSSQTKDEVNFQVMKILQDYFISKGYEHGLSLEAILDIDELVLDQLIYKVGFHRRKATYIKQTANILHEKYNGEIPRTIEEITSFPGVGPKMGFLLLQIAWNINTGIGVDTHMQRMAKIFKWVPASKNMSPEYVRRCFESMLWDHKEEWSRINPILVGFGQVVCLPQRPRCDVCTLSRTGICPAVDKALLKKADMDKQNGIKIDSKSRGDLSNLIKDIEDLR